jgi:hypothetical protein
VGQASFDFFPYRNNLPGAGRGLSRRERTQMTGFDFVLFRPDWGLPSADVACIAPSSDKEMAGPHRDDEIRDFSHSPLCNRRQPFVTVCNSFGAQPIPETVCNPLQHFTSKKHGSQATQNA